MTCGRLDCPTTLCATVLLVTACGPATTLPPPTEGSIGVRTADEEALPSGQRSTELEDRTQAATPPDCTGPLTFDDQEIEAAVREEIGRPHGDILLADVLGLRVLPTGKSNVQTLGGLECLSGLERLRITSDEDTLDLKPLAWLSNLRQLRLDLTTGQVADLTPLAGLHNLEQLDLTAVQVEDLTPLAGLRKLQVLELMGTRVVDLKPLAGLANLERLDLRSTQVVDLEPLAGLTNLRRLNLRSTRVVDLEPLAELHSLRRLDLGGAPVVDLRALAGLHNLRQLNLEGTRVVDLKPLTGLHNLSRLMLGDIPVPCAEQSAIIPVFTRRRCTVRSDCTEQGEAR